MPPSVFYLFIFFASRGKAISVAVVANFTWNLVVTLVFPTELDVIGSALTFGIFAAIDAYALYFIRNKVRLSGVSYNASINRTAVPFWGQICLEFDWFCPQNLGTTLLGI